MWVVERRTQDFNTVTCGIFQIYFYKNLFNPYKISKVQYKTRLNKKAIGLLFNDLFVLDDQEQNERTINKYADEQNITVT